MATAFRATVMLVVLVGLPAAWVYYGPLPPAAMGVIERTVASAKHAFGLGELPAVEYQASETQKTAPRFDPAVSQASQSLQQPPHDQLVDTRPTRLHHDPNFSLASATVATPQPQTVAADTSVSTQIEPHLTLLRSLGAADYTLERWGGDGQFYRFRCSIALGQSDDHTRQFEAVAEAPLQAVREVVGEVTSWQNARHVNTTTRLR